MSTSVKLPDSQEIINRLRDVYDDDYMEERFYVKVAQVGGTELNAIGVVLMLTMKIHDFVNSGYPAVMTSILHAYVPSFIDALVDNQEVATEAKELHKKMTS